MATMKANTPSPPTRTADFILKDDAAKIHAGQSGERVTRAEQGALREQGSATIAQQETDRDREKSGGTVLSSVVSTRFNPDSERA